MLFRLTDHVSEVLAVAGPGVSLANVDGTLRFITASNETVTELERIQELAQRGPCVECFHHGVVIQANDLTVETRWPELVPDAVRVGMRSILALPMQYAEGEALGTINIYDTRVRTWADEDIQAALLLTDIAVSYVTSASELERSERIREQLQQAFDSRVIIEQAKGMIAAEHGIGVDEAFKRLRQHARSRNASLHSVAEAVVNLGLHVN